MYGVTLLIGDSLRYDHIGKGYTPFLNGLSDSSTTYYNHHSRGYATAQSIGSLLSGEDLPFLDIPSPPTSKYLQKLSCLHRKYTSFLFAGIPVVAFWGPQFTVVWNQNWFWDEDVPYYLNPKAPVQIYQRILSIAPSLSFAYLHTFLPHRPYTLKGLEWNWDELDYRFDPESPDHQRQAEERKQEYQKAVIEFDRIAEQIFNLSHNRLFIVSADHGEMLGEGGHFGHIVEREETMHVPLIVHDPEDPQPRTVAGRTDHLQIMPLVCRTLGIEDFNEDPIRHLETLGYV